MPAAAEWVDLPHSWNAVDGQDGGNDYFRGTAYYAKEIKKAELPKAALYYLEIQGANSSADVYLFCIICGSAEIIISAVLTVYCIPAVRKVNPFRSGRHAFEAF